MALDADTKAQMRALIEKFGTDDMGLELLAMVVAKDQGRHGARGGRPRKDQTPEPMFAQTETGLSRIENPGSKLENPGFDSFDEVTEASPPLHSPPNARETPSCREPEPADETAEPDPHDDPTPVVVSLPLVGGKWLPVTERDVSRYRELYPAVDVENHLRRIRDWLETHREKLNRTPKGLRRRITGWLTREHERAVTRPGVLPFAAGAKSQAQAQLDAHAAYAELQRKQMAGEL